MEFATIPEVLDELRQGRFVVVVDDPRRENEGDVICLAELVTPEHVNFMMKHARGDKCTTLPMAWAKRMDLPLQAEANTSPLLCAKCVTVDAMEGTTTGVSASDQAKTIRKLADPNSVPGDFHRPGHMTPIRARNGGVLVRTGHSEASVDLARLAGCRPVAVICEILGEDGEPLRLPGLRGYCREHGLKMTTIEELIRYRRATESLVTRTVSTRVPTEYGVFDIHLYANSVDRNQHIALTMGLDVPPDARAADPLADPVLVRVHSECLTGDIFGSLRCDCGSQLHAAMRAVAARGRGIVLYLRQEGRGIGLANKLLAYRLQEHGLDTVEANKKLGFKADERDYGIGAQILHHLGVRQLALMTNNPKKLQALAGFGLRLVERVPLEMAATKESVTYLRTKRDKLGHLLDGLPGEDAAVEPDE